MQVFVSTVSCAICKTTFTRTNSRSRYCSPSCATKGEGIARRAYQPRQRKLKPEPRLHRQARKAVENAIKSLSGFVRPDECERCGRKCVPHAHHHKGYERAFWLDVVWLCPQCHEAAHASQATSQSGEEITGQVSNG